MAMSFNERSRIRKLTYAGAILAIFTGMYFHRSEILTASADRNNLAETNLGDLDLGGSAVNYALVSFRGPLVTWLWVEADELKNRHEWDKHKVVVTAISKLQPHFRGPWEYQGWNLAYNVSVEFDRAEDKYDYITQGVQWLVQGERMTRYRYRAPDGTLYVVGDPVLRDYIGHVIQVKMASADESEFYRCFFMLSCIPPDRWPTRPGRDLEDFKTHKYPELVRRFRILTSIPEGADSHLDRELIRFLDDHRGLPSRYDWKEFARSGKVQQLADPYSQWPLWPDSREAEAVNTEEEHEQNPFAVAFYWYRFAQEPLPPPGYQPRSMQELRVDRRYRMSRMNLLLARGWPALTKTHHANDLAKIGQFRGLRGAQQKWREAYALWVQFEQENNLSIEFERYEQLNHKAQLYRREYPLYAERNERPPIPPLPVTLSEEERRIAQAREQELIESFSAHLELAKVQAGRDLGRSAFRKKEAEVNMTDEAIAAREHFYLAAHRYKSDLSLARSEYEKGLAIWKRLIVRFDASFAAGNVLNAISAAASGREGGFSLAVGAVSLDLMHGFPNRLVARTITVPQALAPVTAMPNGFGGLTDLGSLHLAAAFLSPQADLARHPAFKYHLDYEVFEYTPLGQEFQVHEEAWEIIDEYQMIRAKTLAPGYLVAAWQLWEHTRLIGGHAATPTISGIALAGLPDMRLLAMAADPRLREDDRARTSPINLDWVENMLETLPSPLDKYLNPTAKRTKDERESARIRRTSPRMGGDISDAPPGRPGG